MAGKSYRDLLAWQKAMLFVEHVYRLTSSFPSEERYGLTSQVRRAAVSVPSNIAEGQGRRSDKELARFLGIAQGSLCEVETQLLIGQRLDYIDEGQITEILSIGGEVGRLVGGLQKSLRI